MNTIDFRCCFDCDDTSCDLSGHDELPYKFCSKSPDANYYEHVRFTRIGPKCDSCKHCHSERDNTPCSKCTNKHKLKITWEHNQQHNKIIEYNKPTESSLEKKEELLYKLARLVRNTDGIHPSSSGPAMGSLLMQLRLLDGKMYDALVIDKNPNYEQWF